MAKYPDPVKGKKSASSGVSRSAAIRKAEAATSRAERGPAKSKYPSMSTASGAAEAAKRGAGVARNAMGGFGKTKPRTGTARSKGAETGGVKKPIVTTRNGVTGGFGKTTGVAAEERRKRGVYRQGRAGGGFGKTRGYVSAPTPEDRAGSKKNVRRAAEKRRASQRTAASKSAAASRKAQSTGVKNKIKRMK